MTYYAYARGMIRCSACEKWIDPETQSYVIEYDTAGHGYHKKKYCLSRTRYPARIRYHSHNSRTRITRQEKATYY